MTVAFLCRVSVVMKIRYLLLAAFFTTTAFADKEAVFKKLANDYVAALQSAKFEALEKIFVSYETFAPLQKKQPVAKKKKVYKSIREKLKSDFDKIQTSASKNNVNWQKLKISDITVNFPPSEANSGVVFVNVDCLYRGQKVDLSFVAIGKGKETSLIEIPISYGVFDKK